MDAAMHVALVVIGDKLGLNKATARVGAIASAELAGTTNTSEHLGHASLLTVERYPGCK